MARKIIKKVPVNGIFSQFKLTESYTNLLLGAIVVLIIGILFISFAKGNRIRETSSTKEEPIGEQKSQQKDATVEALDSKTSSVYTIKPGDNLWSISENFYKDGYKWLEIARANKLENPSLIHAGNKLTMPKVIQVVSPKATDNITKNNAITGNTYTIKPGDNLWDISVRAYGDGYRWPELAKVNNISIPDLIYSDNILTLPR